MAKSVEPKKVAMLRILEILLHETDEEHPMTQEAIREKLEEEYDLVLERKAISRNLTELAGIGIDLESNRQGTWVNRGKSTFLGCGFSDVELRLLIDSVLCSPYIGESQTNNLIKKFFRLSNKFFRFKINSIYSGADFIKTKNDEFFANVELISEAIEKRRQIEIRFAYYDIYKNLIPGNTHMLTPYRFIIKHQKYYLMASRETEGGHEMRFFRVDHILEVKMTTRPATPIRDVPGYKNGIDQKMISVLPYMYSDAPEKIVLKGTRDSIDPFIEWFGDNVRFAEYLNDSEHIRAEITVSPKAMKYWAIQYCNMVEVLSPAGLREEISKELSGAAEKYRK